MKMKWIFAPISLIYSAISYLRWRLYRAGIFKVMSAKSPVISIGNIALGGTGKTPFVIWLAKKLVEEGYSPVILSRGYGRRNCSREFIIDNPTNACLAGDEPALMSKNIPNVPVIVHPDRYASIQEFGDNGDNIFLLDDGFQHIKLYRNLDIVSLPAEDPFSSGRFFPWGGLRDGLWRLKEADIIILMGENKENYDEIKKRLSPECKIVYAHKKFLSVKNMQGIRLREEVLNAKKVVAFAGICSSRSFTETIEQTGAIICSKIWFRDHHIYTKNDIKKIEIEAERCDADFLVTTEKDAVRLAGFNPRIEVLVICIDIIIDQEAELLKAINEKIKIKH